jgi:hypothetical protein
MDTRQHLINIKHKTSILDYKIFQTYTGVDTDTGKRNVYSVEKIIG